MHPPVHLAAPGEAGFERLDLWMRHNLRTRLFLLGGSLDPLEGALDLVARSCGHLAPLLLTARFEGSEVVARIANDARQAPPRFLARGLDLLLDRVEVTTQLARQGLQGVGKLRPEQARRRNSSDLLATGLFRSFLSGGLLACRCRSGRFARGRFLAGRLSCVWSSVERSFSDLLCARSAGLWLAAIERAFAGVHCATHLAN